LKVSFWFVVIASVFVTCLITANIIAVKIISVSVFLVPAGIIIFPLSYLFGDVLTEVYGYGPHGALSGWALHVTCWR
jgi:queuosine precursor transporter